MGGTEISGDLRGVTEHKNRQFSNLPRYPRRALGSPCYARIRKGVIRPGDRKTFAKPLNTAAQRSEAPARREDQAAAPAAG